MAKTVLVLSLLVVALFLGIGATLPESWEVEASRRIAAPPERVLAEVQDLRKWKEWSSISASMGQGTEVSVDPPGVGVGAVMRWRGPDGEARLTVVEASAEEGLRYRFEVSEIGVIGEGGVRFAPADGGTEVTWFEKGNLDTLLQRWLWRLGVGLEEAVRGQRETSLANLKLRIEEGSRDR